MLLLGIQKWYMATGTTFHCESMKANHIMIAATTTNICIPVLKNQIRWYPCNPGNVIKSRILWIWSINSEFVQHTLGSLKDSTNRSLWSKTTLITGDVGMAVSMHYGMMPSKSPNIIHGLSLKNGYFYYLDIYILWK